MFEFLQTADYLTLIDLQTLSNFAVFGAFIFAIMTFYITQKDNNKSEQLKRVQEIQKMLSREYQNMFQNFYSTLQNPMFQESSKEPTFSTHSFNKYLYQPVVDTAEWASFLLLSKDIERRYEKHLINQIREVYETTQSMFPELLENDDYQYLKNLMTDWRIRQRK